MLLPQAKKDYLAIFDWDYPRDEGFTKKGVRITLGPGGMYIEGPTESRAAMKKKRTTPTTTTKKAAVATTDKGKAIAATDKNPPAKPKGASTKGVVIQERTSEKPSADRSSADELSTAKTTTKTNPALARKQFTTIEAAYGVEDGSSPDSLQEVIMKKPTNKLVVAMDKGASSGPVELALLRVDSPRVEVRSAVLDREVGLALNLGPSRSSEPITTDLQVASKLVGGNKWLEKPYQLNL